ncbi:MAG: hypothetical protein V4505_25610 [Pseudomonadota bacterium]
MSVENATTIAGLNPNWPPDIDPLAEAAAHLREIKLVLQNAQNATISPSSTAKILANMEAVQNAILNSVLAPGSLPAQSGNAGKFLGTDGASVSWQSAGSIVRMPVTASQAITAANKANLLECSGIGISLTAAASTTLTGGYFCYVSNSGTDPVTITPNGSETINGRTAWPVNAGDVLLLVSDGLNLYIKRLDGAPQFGSPGTAVVAAASATNAFIATCALSATRSFGIYQNGSTFFPQAVLRDATGATIATAQIEAAQVTSGTAPQIIPLTATTALLMYVSGAPAVQLVILTDNGASIGVGSIATLASASSSAVCLMPFSATKVGAFYFDSTNTLNKYSVATIAGTAVTAPAVATLSGPSNYSTMMRAAAISATQGVLMGVSGVTNLTLAVPITEASTVITVGVERTVANNVFSGGAGGDIGYVSGSRVVMCTGASGSAVGYAFTVDMSGAGSTAILANGKMTPVAPTGARKFRITKVSPTTFIAIGMDNAGISEVLLPMFVRGQAVEVGAGIGIAAGGSGEDICVTGAVALAFFADSKNSGFPTSKPIPLGSIL